MSETVIRIQDGRNSFVVTLEGNHALDALDVVLRERENNPDWVEVAE